MHNKNKLLSIALTSLAAVSAANADVKLSGQVNQAIVGGDVADEATVVDNNMTGSRFRFTGDFGEGAVKAGFRYEIQMQANQSSASGAGQQVGSNTQEVRWSQVYLKGDWGKLGLGKSEGAASDVADSTFANGNFYSTTQLIFLAYRGVYRDKIGDPSAGLFVPFDAAGRSVNVQYNSPSFSGFTFALGMANGAQGSGNENEAAIRYKGKVGPGKLTARYGVRDTDAAEFKVGSFLYQTDFGLNVGAGIGERDDNSDLDWTSYAIGWKKGRLGASFEYAENDNDEEVTSYGVTYRVVNGVNVYANVADFDVTDGAMVGMHIKF